MDIERIEVRIASLSTMPTFVSRQLLNANAVSNQSSLFLWSYRSLQP